MGAEKGLLKEANVVDLGMPAVRDFLLPPSMEVDWNLPPLIRETVRRVFTREAEVRPQKMQLCGTCINVCPAGAIAGGETKISFDYHKCIRCFCCSEMCPSGAIRLKTGGPGDGFSFYLSRGDDGRGVASTISHAVVPLVCKTT